MAAYVIVDVEIQDMAQYQEYMRQVKPVIDQVYPLSETAEAMRYLGAGHARGKVVITVAE